MVKKYLNNRAPYTGSTFNDQAHRIFGQSGLLTGLTVQKDPTNSTKANLTTGSFVQNGLIVEIETGDISAFYSIAGWSRAILYVTTASNRDEDGVTIRTTDSIANLPSFHVIVAQWDGTEWVQEPYISLTGILNSIARNTIAVGDVGIHEGFDLSIDDDLLNYTITAGHLLNKEGYSYTANEDKVVTVIDPDPHYRRVDYTIYNKLNDRPGRPHNIDIALGNTFSDLQLQEIEFNENEAPPDIAPSRFATKSVVDSSNKVFTFYIDDSYNLKCTLQVNHATQAKREDYGGGIIDCSLNQIYDIVDVVIDSSDAIHVLALYDSAGTKTLKYRELVWGGATFAVATSEDLKTDSLANSAYSGASLAMDVEENIFVVYSYNSDTTSFKYQIYGRRKTLGDSVFRDEQEIQIGANDYKTPMIAIDVDGHIYITCLKDTNSILLGKTTASFSFIDDLSAVNTTIGKAVDQNGYESATYTTVQSQSIAVNSKNEPCISFIGVAGGEQQVILYTPDCEAVTGFKCIVLGTELGTGRGVINSSSAHDCPDIVIDGIDNLHISFIYNDGTNSAFGYMKLTPFIPNRAADNFRFDCFTYDKSAIHSYLVNKVIIDLAGSLYFTRCFSGEMITYKSNSALLREFIVEQNTNLWLAAILLSTETIASKNDITVWSREKVTTHKRHTFITVGNSEADFVGHNAINDAIAELKSRPNRGDIFIRDGEYEISEPIQMYSGMGLIVDGSVTLKRANSADEQPIINIAGIYKNDLAVTVNFTNGENWIQYIGKNFITDGYSEGDTVQIHTYDSIDKVYTFKVKTIENKTKLILDRNIDLNSTELAYDNKFSLYVSRCKIIGIDFEEYGENAIHVNAAYKLIATHNFFQNSKNGILAENSYGCVFDENEYEECEINGFLGKNLKTCSISKNRFKANGNNGIRLENGDDASKGNILDANVTDLDYPNGISPNPQIDYYLEGDNLLGSYLGTAIEASDNKAELLSLHIEKDLTVDNDLNIGNNLIVGENINFGGYLQDGYYDSQLISQDFRIMLLEGGASGEGVQDIFEDDSSLDPETGVDIFYENDVTDKSMRPISREAEESFETISSPVKTKYMVTNDDSDFDDPESLDWKDLTSSELTQGDTFSWLDTTLKDLIITNIGSHIVYDTLYHEGAERCCVLYGTRGDVNAYLMTCDVDGSNIKTISFTNADGVGSLTLDAIDSGLIRASEDEAGELWVILGTRIDIAGTTYIRPVSVRVSADTSTSPSTSDFMYTNWHADSANYTSRHLAAIIVKKSDVSLEHRVVIMYDRSVESDGFVGAHWDDDEATFPKIFVTYETGTQKQFSSQYSFKQLHLFLQGYDTSPLVGFLGITQNPPGAWRAAVEIYKLTVSTATEEDDYLVGGDFYMDVVTEDHADCVPVMAGNESYQTLVWTRQYIDLPDSVTKVEAMTFDTSNGTSTGVTTLKTYTDSWGYPRSIKSLNIYPDGSVNKVVIRHSKSNGWEQAKLDIADASNVIEGFFGSYVNELRNDELNGDGVVRAGQDYCIDSEGTEFLIIKNSSNNLTLRTNKKYIGLLIEHTMELDNSDRSYVSAANDAMMNIWNKMAFGFKSEASSPALDKNGVMRIYRFDGSMWTSLQSFTDYDIGNDPSLVFPSPETTDVDLLTGSVELADVSPPNATVYFLLKHTSPSNNIAHPATIKMKQNIVSTIDEQFSTRSISYPVDSPFSGAEAEYHILMRVKKEGSAIAWADLQKFSIFMSFNDGVGYGEIDVTGLADGFPAGGVELNQLSKVDNLGFTWGILRLKIIPELVGGVDPNKLEIPGWNNTPGAFRYRFSTLAQAGHDEGIWLDAISIKKL